MKKTLTTLAAVAALGAAAATPALAQPVVTFSFGNTGYGYGVGSIQERQARIAWEIRQGQRMGTIDWREARRLHNELNRVERMERIYARGGFTRAEVINLSRSLSALENRVQYAMNDGYGERYGDRYGYGYGYGRY